MLSLKTNRLHFIPNVLPSYYAAALPCTLVSSNERTMNNLGKRIELYTQKHSPHCRKVIVFLIEYGLADSFTAYEEDTSPVINNELINELNPLGKVPILKHNGLVIIDSTNICRYIDEEIASNVIYTNNSMNQFQRINLEAIGSGICDTGILLKQERERRLSNKASDRFEKGLERKITNTLAYLEVNSFLLDESYHLGQISIAVALDWLNFAKMGIELQDYPNTLDWFKKFNQRESMKRTQFSGEVDDGFKLEGLLARTKLHLHLHLHQF